MTDKNLTDASERPLDCVVRHCTCGHDTSAHDRGRKACLVDECTCSVVKFMCKCGHDTLDHEWWGGGNCLVCDCNGFIDA